jgi:uncharacterized protein YgiM (DUF1202 family)
MLLNFKTKSLVVFFMVCLGLRSAVFADTFSVFTGQINASGINVRVDATVGAEVICTLAKGELVEIVWEAYDWYKIRLPVEAPAYIKKNLLECNYVNADFASLPDNKCLSAKVIKDKVNIRLKPTESAWILGKVDKATVVNIVAEEEGWYKIQPVYQSYGWVNKKFVNKDVSVLKKQDASVKVINPVKPGEQLIVEGKVSPYGIVLWRKATHKLITLENKIYLLRGDRKSLDSLNYHKVKITGKLISLATSPVGSGAPRRGTSNGASPAGSKYPIIQIDIIEALN